MQGSVAFLLVRLKFWQVYGRHLADILAFSFPSSLLPRKHQWQPRHINTQVKTVGVIIFSKIHTLNYTLLITSTFLYRPTAKSGGKMPCMQWDTKDIDLNSQV